MRLSTKSEYACLALIVLTEDYNKNRLCTISEIAQRKDIPKKYLEQILLILKRAGYVKSYKGADGGYRLAKKPQQISVADIVRLMDGALAPVESVSKYFYEHTPIERSKKLLAVFRQIRDYISDTLEGVTFDKLI
jgi:Rrf2 family protein